MCELWNYALLVRFSANIEQFSQQAKGNIKFTEKGNNFQEGLKIKGMVMNYWMKINVSILKSEQWCSNKSQVYGFFTFLLSIF